MAEAPRREVPGRLVSGCPALCGCDDGGEVLDLERIGTCSAHVLEGSPKVIHRAGMVLPLEALGRLLHAKALFLAGWAGQPDLHSS